MALFPLAGRAAPLQRGAIVVIESQAPSTLAGSRCSIGSIPFSGFVNARTYARDGAAGAALPATMVSAVYNDSAAGTLSSSQTTVTAIRDDWTLQPVSPRGSVTFGPSTPALMLFESSGLFRPIASALPEVNAIDLAADRCTMFFVTGSAIGRYDVCGERALASFAQSDTDGIRVLPDRGLLAAGKRELLRFDRDGKLKATIPLPLLLQEQVTGFTLDVDPSIAWVVTAYTCTNAEPGHIMAVSLDSGAIVTGPAPLADSWGRSVLVVGGWRAAVDPPPMRRRAAR